MVYALITLFMEGVCHTPLHTPPVAREAKAPKGRNHIAQGNALWKNTPQKPAPRRGIIKKTITPLRGLFVTFF